MLNTQNFLLIHCAAGIHRTGLFSYSLLRISGLSKEQTLQAIQQIRNVTYEKCGTTRFELGEALATQILEESICKEIEELQSLQTVKFVADPLVWIKITPTHAETLRFECIVTDKNLSEYVLGPNLNLKISFGYLIKSLGEDWISQKEVQYLPGGINKNFKIFEKELLLFFKESFPQGIGNLIGKACFLEKRFIEGFWPSVNQYMSQTIFDTDVYGEMNQITSESIYQEIISFKPFLNKAFLYKQHH